MELPKVIYVDDEPGLLEITKIFLEEDGDVQVDTEQCSMNVLDLLDSRPYDVIVSDYQMPGMNGIELLKALRARGDLTPFILFTGKGREEVAIEALNNGADLYLQKGGDPRVQFGELKNAIVQLVQRKKAERQVAQSEQKYRDLVEGAGSIILKLDSGGRIIFLNQYGREYFSCTSDVTGELALSALFKPEEYSERELGDIQRTFSSNSDLVATYTFPVRRKDGTKAWVSWNIKTHRDRDGKVAELLAIGNDVTAAKNTETELQRSTSQLRAMLDLSEDGVMMLDSDHDVVQFNQGLLEVWNLPSSAMETRSHAKLIDMIKDQLKDPEGLSNAIGQGKDAPGYEGKRLLELRDGRFLDVRSTPLMIGNSAIGRLLIFKDHAQDRAGGRGMGSEAAFRELYDDNLATILFIEPETGNIVDANESACRFYGYGHDVLRGMRFYEDISMLPESIERSRLAEKGVRRFSSKHKVAGGEVRDVEVFTGPVISNGRKLLFTMVQDMTEMNRAKRLFEKLGVRNDDLLDLVGEGVLLVDPGDRIVYANHRIEDMLQTASGGLINTTFLSHVATGSLGEATGNQRRRVEGYASRSDYRMIRTDGSEFWAMVSAKPVFKDDRFAGTTYFISDVNERREREDWLKAREVNMHQIIKSALGGIWVVDRDWKTTFVNDNMAKALGYSKEELRGRPMTGLLDERSRRVLSERNGPDGAAEGQEVAFLHRDGSVVPARLSFFSVQYGNGKLGGSVAFVSDANDRIIIREIACHQCKLEKLAASISGRLINARMEEMDQALAESLERVGTFFGADRGSVLLIGENGRSLDCASSWCGEGVAPLVVNSNAVDGQVPWWMVAFGERNGFLIPNVSDFPAGAEEPRTFLLSNRMRSLMAIPLMAEGSIIGFLGFDSVRSERDWNEADIEVLKAFGGLFVSALQRKKADNAVKEAEGLYRSSMDSLSDGVYVIDIDRRILFVNQALTALMKKAGLDVEVIGRSVFEVLPALKDRIESEVDQVFKQGRSVISEEALLINGNKALVLVQRLPLWDRGRIDRVLMMVHDITERKGTEESLDGAAQKLNLLYDITRHDINNQLMVLRGNLDILRDRVVEPGCQVRLSNIGACAESIWRQLEFTKAYQEMGTKTPQWQDMGALIDGMPVGSSRIKRLEASPRLRKLMIYGDPMLGKVFHNLLEDSMRYASDPTMIKMGCQEFEDHLIITYEDIGPGVPSEEKEGIFSSGHGRGTGFGLYLSREILAITGMTIRETGEPGKGAKFEITVPQGQYRFDGLGFQVSEEPLSGQAFRATCSTTRMGGHEDHGASGPFA